MSKILKHFSAVMLTDDGVNVQAYGSLLTPIKTVVLADGRPSLLRTVKVPAGEKATLWEWDQTGEFQMIMVRMHRSEGAVYMAYRATAATSLTDKTPLGTSPAWCNLTLWGASEFCLDSTWAYVDTADPASDDDAGEPAVWGSATKALGTIDKLMAYNAEATDYFVDVLVVPA